MKHKHHIVPKHMGGSNDHSNIVLLSIEEHAEAHRVLFEQFGKIEDNRAWRGLSGLSTKEEILAEIFRDNGLRNVKYLLDSSTKETCSKGGKLGLATLISRNPNHQSDVGKLGAQHENFKTARSKLHQDSVHQSKAGKAGGVASGKARKGKPHPNPGNIGKKWFTNGTKNAFTTTCPIGFYPGKTHKKRAMIV